VYGTALGATQLNATASVPGTFVYAPPAGTVLNAGNRAIAIAAKLTATSEITEHIERAKLSDFKLCFDQRHT